MILFLYLVYLLLPMALLFFGSFGEKWTNTLLPQGFTFRWYLEVASDPSFQRAFFVSLFVAIVTCTIVVLIGVPMAYGMERGKLKRTQFLTRLLQLMPIAAPPMVVAFGYIILFSSDAFPYLGTTWLLILGHVVSTLPYMVQTLIGDIRHLGLVQLEQAADSLGANFPQRFLHVVVPTLRHSILSGLFTVGALSIGEFQLSNLIAGFLNRTYPIVLLQSFYNATGFACSATVVLLVLSIVASLLGTSAPSGTLIERKKAL
ncbi:MAG: ABC transporter permease subunit [Spirochaetales bacterium]